MRTPTSNDVVLYDGYASNVDIASNALRIENMFGYSIQVVFSGFGTLGGNILLESTDAIKDLGNNNQPVSTAKWAGIVAPVDSTKALSLIGTHDSNGNVIDNIVYNIGNAFYRFVRVKTYNLTGSTNIKIYAFAKGV